MTRCLAAALAAALPATRGAAGYASVGSALMAARQLTPPRVEATKNGEFEGADFWEEHDDLLTRAWAEHGPRHSTLYTYGLPFEARYLSPELRTAAATARAVGDE